MKAYGQFIKKHWSSFLMAVAFLGLETFSDLMQPMLVSKLIDQGIVEENMALIAHYGGLMLGMTCIGMVGALMRNWLSSNVSFSIAMELREMLYEKLLTFPMLKVEGMERGSLITRLTSDVTQVQLFINGLMRIFLKAPLLAIGSFIMVLNLNRRFLSVYLAVIPLAIVLVSVNLKIGYPLYARIQKVVDRLNQNTMEFLSGIRTVKAFNRFDYENQKFHLISDDLRQITTRTMRIMAAFGPVILLIVNMAIVAVLYKGSAWVHSGEIGVGEIVAFINYMTQFYFALSVITRVFNVFVRAKTSAARISEVIAYEDIEEMKAVQMPEALHLTFDNVSFRFGEGEETLKDLNFNIEYGASIGILGSTGSGKTTLIRLINGILKSSSGAVKIGGIPLDQISSDFLKKNIAYVPQNNMLFTGSIADNLRYGSENASEAEMWRALEIAMAKPFVTAMPDQLETLIGKNGVNISGGEKQRLSIARAIIHQPKILILDDSTSALDVLTERALKQHLRDLGDLTLIVVAQKISSVMDLDRIIILNNGEVEAFGTHEELLETSPIYLAIYQAELGQNGGGDHDSKF
ncbi:ABC transporter ATP-binding protein [Fusibacter ferrireducens]|uniref:ABC transporter ATP-binding protein n=1 Tax=Fusibacter ferrireducens TaxID=2785058 RepID=A0ABR9ZPP9_9FIRM|nr:ABC transporter ATP-binding protein [Fusibacter ferrireducens]MBF4692441.1 ABC transporter ATP-binding protein [Fusibacter ferrireducens]